jgi:hypothetical protein
MWLNNFASIDVDVPVVSDDVRDERALMLGEPVYYFVTRPSWL